MKKFWIFVIVLVIAAVAVVQYSGNFQPDADGLTLAEAKFSVSTERTTHPDSFLVGKFARADGTLLEFFGDGNLREVAKNFTEKQGTYSLTQAEDGAAVLKIVLDNKPVLYTFEITSRKGEITMRDKANIAYVLTPVP